MKKSLVVTSRNKAFFLCGTLSYDYGKCTRYCEQGRSVERRVLKKGEQKTFTEKERRAIKGIEKIFGSTYLYILEGRTSCGRLFNLHRRIQSLV